MVYGVQMGKVKIFRKKVLHFFLEIDMTKLLSKLSNHIMGRILYKIAKERQEALFWGKIGQNMPKSSCTIKGLYRHYVRYVFHVPVSETSSYLILFLDLL